MNSPDESETSLNARREYISRIHICLNKLEQTPPSSPQSGQILRTLLEHIPLTLTLNNTKNEPVNQRRDPELLKLFLERNFFNNLAFYIDSSNGNTVIAAVAVLNALFIRHYIDIPFTIRVFLAPLFKAITSVQLSPISPAESNDVSTRMTAQYTSELETITFLHNILAFITLLLRACESMQPEAKREQIYQQYFHSEYAIKSLRYVYQRFLLFLTKHWYDATFDETQLNRLDALNTPIKPSVHGEPPIQPPKRTKTTLLTPLQSIELFYKGVEYLLVPFVGFINVYLNSVSPSDVTVAQISEMIYHSRDILHRTYLTHIPLLCDNSRYFCNLQQCAVQTSFFQLFFQVTLLLLRVASVDEYVLTRRQVLIDNWAFNTLLYFTTLYHQSQLAPESAIYSIDSLAYSAFEKVNDVRKTLELYKQKEEQDLSITLASSTSSAVLIEMDGDVIDKTPMAAEAKPEGETNEGSQTIPQITFKQVVASIPRIASLAFTTFRRSMPLTEGRSMHYDLAKALVLTGIFKYLFGQQIIFPRPNISALYITREFLDENEAAMIKMKAEEEEKAKEGAESVENAENDEKIEASSSVSENITEFTEVENEKPIMLPGAVYEEKNGILVSLFPPTIAPIEEKQETSDDVPKTPEEIKKELNKIQENEDYNSVLYMTLMLLKIVDYNSEPSWQRDHPFAAVTRDRDGVPVRENSEFLRYFINSCQLYPFMLKYVQQFGSQPDSAITAICWELLENGVLDCMTFPKALKLLQIELIKSLKQEQYKQLDLLKKNTTMMANWVHEFWTWKRKRVFFRVNAIKAKEQRAKEIKSKQDSKKNNSNVKTDGDATDMEAVMDKEDNMRKHMQLEQAELQKDDVESTIAQPLDDIGTERKDELPSAVQESKSENTAENTAENTTEKSEITETLREDSEQSDEIKYKHLFDYPIPHNYLDKSPEDLIMYTLEQEAGNEKLKEDITIYLMTKAPIQFQQDGFNFYFYSKPAPDNFLFDLPQDALDHSHIFTPAYFDLLCELTKNTVNNQYHYSVENMVFSEEGNYFTYIMGLYQRSKHILRSEPIFLPRAVSRHVKVVVNSVITSPPLVNGTLLQDVFENELESKLDFYKSVGIGCVRHATNSVEQRLSTTGVMISDEPPADVSQHHQVIFNEFGESEYIRSLDRNLLPINLERNELHVNDVLFTLITEMKIMLKRQAVYQLAAVVPAPQTALAMNSAMLNEIYKEFIKEKSRQKVAMGEELTQEEHSTLFEENEKGKNFDENDEKLEEPMEMDEKKIQEDQFDYDSEFEDSELSEGDDDEYDEPDQITITKTTDEYLTPKGSKKMQKKLKKPTTADVYKLKPSDGVVKTEDGGVVFDTQGMRMRKAEKYMHFTFDLLRPDSLSKHEYQTYRFSDRRTTDIGVYDYVRKTIDFEKEREFFIKQIKYEQKQSFFNIDEEFNEDDKTRPYEELNLVDFGDDLRRVIEANSEDEGDDQKDDDEDDNDGLDVTDFYLRGLSAPQKKVKYKKKSKTVTTPNNPTEVTSAGTVSPAPSGPQGTLKEQFNKDPNAKVFYEDPIPQHFLERISEQQKAAEVAVAKKDDDKPSFDDSELVATIESFEEREEELMEEMDKIFRQIEQLNDVKKRNISVIKETEYKLFAKRPVPKDRKSTEFTAYVNDMTRFEKWSKVQQDKLSQIDELLEEKALEFKVYRDIIQRLDMQKEQAIAKFTEAKKQEQEKAKNGDNTVIQIHDKFTNDKNNDKKSIAPVDSDYEEYQNEQESMKNHWLAQQRIRKGEKPADSVITSKDIEQKDEKSKNNDENQPIILHNGYFSTKNLSLPLKTKIDNIGELTIAGVRTIPLIPSNSILRHNPRLQYVPHPIPTVVPAGSKMVPQINSPPLEDDEIWTHKDNNFDWLDQDPREGLIAYTDTSVQREMRRRLADHDDNDANHTDIGDLSDVFSVLKNKRNKVQEHKKQPPVESLRQDLDAIIKQDYDVTREQLERLYRDAKSWTYEDMYLFLFQYPQQSVYDMKRSMEFYLRVRLPTDYKDIEILEEPEKVFYDQQNDYKILAKDGQTEKNDKLVVTKLQEEKEKEEKLGDEDKLIGLIALRRQKLLARFQLPYIYRYIHERINNIPPPPVITPIIESLIKSLSSQSAPKKATPKEVTTKPTKPTKPKNPLKAPV